MNSVCYYIELDLWKKVILNCKLVIIMFMMENLYFVFISIDYEFLVVNILYDKKVMEECFIYWWYEDVIDLS